MATVTIDLRDELAMRLENEAKRLNVTVEQLVELGMQDFLRHPDERFGRIADRVVRENRELYRLLA